MHTWQKAGQTGELLHSSSEKALISLTRDLRSDISASQRLCLLKTATISTQEFQENHSVHTDVINICFVSFLLWFVFPCAENGAQGFVCAQQAASTELQPQPLALLSAVLWKT